eukprot:12982470-Ditylum_brightwellii.AAC.1
MVTDNNEMVMIDNCRSVFLPVDSDGEARINNKVDEFMSELNSEVVEMNLDARRILTTANTPAS